MIADTLKAPFPYFGGKSKIASLVWERFGKPDNYVEPFFGSGAVLLACPWPGHTETVNDADGLLANFFRSTSMDAEAVASYADWPVNEADLHARHRWLVDRRSLVEDLMADPEWYDAQAAGWWVWGISQWIGTGWCPPTPAGVADVGGGTVKRPHIGDAGMGIHRGSDAHAFDHKVSTRDGELWQRRPQLSDNRGVQRLAHKRPSVGGTGDRTHKGRGEHRTQLARKMPFVASPAPDRKQYGLGVHGKRLSQQMPHLQGDSGATGKGIHKETIAESPSALYAYFRALQARLRRTRVVCGDFERILGPSVTWRHGRSAVFLDPPYLDGEHSITYSGGGNVWHRVTRYCEENGNNPLLKIALCGYLGTWEPPPGWTFVQWRTSGGYGSQGDARGRANASREVIWFSPHCDAPAQLKLDF